MIIASKVLAPCFCHDQTEGVLRKKLFWTRVIDIVSSDGFGRKALQMAVRFGYYRRGFEDYPGNIDLHLAITKIWGLNVNTAKQDERRKSQDRRMAEDRRMRPKLWSQAAAFRDGSGLSKRTKPERRQNDARRQSEQEEVTISSQRTSSSRNL
ncbi:MAG: hypothetical protein CMF63_08790 [Magnetovibrio sp.]|nr:hypothetical protein [Magnetovibrio sp.]